MKKFLLNSTLLLCTLIVGLTPAWGTDSGLTASHGTFIIDFYDSDKLSSYQGTALTSANYLNFVKVEAGLNKADVVTGVTVTGTVQYGKNGGLTAGTGTAAGADSHKFSLSIGSDYAVTKVTIYATYYEEGIWRVNGKTTSVGTYGSKGCQFSAITNPLVWSNLNDLTSLEFTKMKSGGGNQQRMTIYAIVCEYTTTAPTTTTISSSISNTDLKNGTVAGSLSASVTPSGESTLDSPTISWSSSDETVATVTSDGIVTLVGVGSATITASYAGDETYSASSDTYDINVTDSREATTTTIDDDGLTNTDIKNGVAAGTLSASVQYGTPASDVPSATVTWSSSDETVATIDGNGLITLLKAGTTTIRATYAGATISETQYGSSFGTYTLTVTDTRQAMYAFVNNWNTLFGTSYTGVLSGDNQKTYSGTQNGVTVEYAKGSGSNMYMNDSEIRLYKGVTVSFESPSANYVITKILFTGTINSDKIPTPSVGSYNNSTKTWTGSASKVVFTGTATSANISTASITLSYPRSASNGNFGTICFPQSVNSSTGVEAFYTVAGYRGSASDITSVVLVEASTPLTAGKPYIFEANADAQTFSVTGDMVASPVTTENNGLVGQFIAGTITDNDCSYIIRGDKVYKIDGDEVNCPANRAYFNFKDLSPYSDQTPTPGRRIIEIPMAPNNATSIQTLQSSDETVKFFENGQLFILRDGIIYDLLGRIVK